MKIYLEAIEQALPGAQAEFVRLDVTENTEEERTRLLAALKDFMLGLICQYSWHYCYHDEDKPCHLVVL